MDAADQVAPTVGSANNAAGDLTHQAPGAVPPPPSLPGHSSGKADALSLFNYLMGP